jgi:hypothetical protein
MYYTVLFVDLLGLCMAFNMSLIIPVIFKNVVILLSISFSFSYDTKFPKLLNMFTCSIILLFITIYYLLGLFP